MSSTDLLINFLFCGFRLRLITNVTYTSIKQNSACDFYCFSFSQCNPRLRTGRKKGTLYLQPTFSQFHLKLDAVDQCSQLSQGSHISPGIILKLIATRKLLKLIH